MTSTIEIEVPGTTPGDFDYINVEFSVETAGYDDSITVDGYADEREKHLEAVSDPTYNKLNHTKWENKAITTYLSDHKKCSKVCDDLVELQLKEYAGAEPEYDSND